MQLGICCSPERQQLAIRLARRLERNLGLTALLAGGEGDPISEQWEQVSECGAILVMLDHGLAPGPVRREAWLPLIEHNGTPPLAVLKCENCAFPPVLARGTFFDCGADEVAAMRWVERWLAGLLHPAGPEGAIASCGGVPVSKKDWWEAGVDAPGSLTVLAEDLDAVQSFASEVGPHFERVVWMGCEGLPPAALAAELQYRCRREERALVVLVHAESEVAALPESRHSFVIVKGKAQFEGVCRASGFPASMLELMEAVPLTVDGSWHRPRHGTAPTSELCERHLQKLEKAFGEWRRSARGLCRDLTGEAAWAIARDPVSSRRLCFELAQFLLAERRKDEAIVWLKLLAANDLDDWIAVEVREKLKWEDDGVVAAPVAGPVAQQLDLFKI